MYFNNLSLYRYSIYKMIDAEFKCDWYIEDVNTGVKEFPDSELGSVSRLAVKQLGSFYWTHGLLALLKKNYDIYFMLGATRNLTLLPFCILKKIFFPKKRVYFWTHGYYGKESWLQKGLWKRPMLKVADGVFTYGEYAKRLMIEDGFNDRRIYPIHNSLDYDNQLKLRNCIKATDIYSRHFGNDNPTLIFIGRLTKVKRLDMLIEAVSILKAKNEFYNLIFVGDGTIRNELEAMAKEKAISEQTWFWGECYDEEQNAELVYNADLCVAPGNIGLTSIHALMFGCPAISHNNFSQQMPEFEVIKKGITGDFYEYSNVNDLATTISKWFREHKGQRNRVREACYREIDTLWNPYFQLDVIKKYLK